MNIFDEMTFAIAKKKHKELSRHLLLQQQQQHNKIIINLAGLTLSGGYIVVPVFIYSL